MASYVLSGYTTPQGINSSSAVKQMQRQLGVKADGIWGPITQAAYDRQSGVSFGASYQSGASSAVSQLTSGLSAFMQGIKGLLDAPQISYEPQSSAALQSQIESMLRPGYDLAIKNRRAQTLKNRAEIDTDALSRGMGKSTYVTDVKDRQMEYEADDISTLEAQYSAALGQMLMQAIQEEQNRYMQVQQYNQQQQSEVNKLALSYAQSAYGDYISELQRAQSKSSTGSAKSSAKATTPQNCYAYLSGLSASQRASIYSGATPNDRVIRDELIASLGQSGYLEAQQRYPG